MNVGTTILPIEREKEILLITDIPAKVCANCGETYLDEAIAKGVQDLAQKTLAGEVSYAALSSERKVSVLPYAA
jgi:YgiT-type zinc finger domain-containing protein